MKKGTVLIVALIVACSLRVSIGQSVSIAIVDVTVVDVLSGQLLPNRTVTIRDQTIVDVDTRRPPDATVRTLDGSGKFLIPGLWDMHAHRFETWLALDVANGVTGIRDMGNDLDEILRLRAATLASEVVGPRIVAAGPILDDAPADWPLRQRVRNAGEGRAAVQQLKRRGVDLIKVHNFTPRDAFFAIVEEARQLQLPVAGHIPLNVTIEEAIETGLTSIEHFSEDGRAWQGCSGGRTYRADSCAPFFSRLAANGIWQTPTLVAITARGAAGTAESRIRREDLVYVPQAVAALWAAEQAALTPSGRLALNESGAVAPVVAKDMARAGVGILAGCDSGVAGFCVHAELELMVNGGMTPLEALRTATINSARYLGFGERMGSVSAGKAADLVLLDGNPIADIANVRRVRAVVLRGRVFDRPALDVLLSGAKAEAAKF